MSSHHQERVDTPPHEREDFLILSFLERAASSLEAGKPTRVPGLAPLTFSVNPQADICGPEGPPQRLAAARPLVGPKHPVLIRISYEIWSRSGVWTHGLDQTGPAP